MFAAVLAGTSPEGRTEAMPILERGCSASHAVSCLAMGVLVEEYFDASGADALRWYEASCKLEQVEGCERAGIVVSQSVDPGDREKAAGLLAKACDGGRGLACVLAAELGGEESDLAATSALKEKGQDMLRTTCESGKGQECFWLSEGIGQGRLVGTQADAAAFRTRACALGLEEACAPR